MTVALTTEDKAQELIEKRMKEYKIEPFPESGLVTYIPVEDHYSRVDLQQKKRLYAPNIQLKHRIMEMNPTTKKLETLVYVESYIPAIDEKGNPFLNPIMPQIFMTNGALRLNERNLALYVFLECSSENLSNPNRNPSVTPKFRKLDFAKDREEVYQRIEAKNKAERIAIEYSIEQIKELAPHFNIDITQKQQEIRKDFVIAVSSDPIRFLSLIQEPTVASQKEELVDTYIKSKAVKLNGTSWVFSEELGGKDIVMLEMGVAARDTLKKFIENGSAASKAAIKTLNQHLKL